jgi:hypothetical protein
MDNFWHEYMTTGGKLKSPMGGWINPTHRIWHWYYDKNREALYHINGPTIRLFARATGWRCTRSTTMFELKQTTSTTKIIPKRGTNIGDDYIRIEGEQASRRTITNFKSRCPGLLLDLHQLMGRELDVRRNFKWR